MVGRRWKLFFQNGNLLQLASCTSSYALCVSTWNRPYSVTNPIGKPVYEPDPQARWGQWWIMWERRARGIRRPTLKFTQIALRRQLAKNGKHYSARTVRFSFNWISSTRRGIMNARSNVSFVIFNPSGRQNWTNDSLPYFTEGRRTCSPFYISNNAVNLMCVHGFGW